MKDEEILRAVVAAIIFTATYNRGDSLREFHDVAEAMKVARQIIEAAKQ